MSSYMFDTNIFNRLLDGNDELARISGKVCYATHIQWDEIQATRDPQRRLKLEKIFSQVLTEQIPTESTVWDVSRWDMAKLSNGETYNQILKKLNERNKGKPNNIQDALIAETAIANRMILVTEDHDLGEVVTEMHGSVCNLKALLP